MKKPCNLIEFKNDELMEWILDDIQEIGLETEDCHKYGKLCSYIGTSLTTGKVVEFCSYLKEDVLQSLVNARAYLLR